MTVTVDGVSVTSPYTLTRDCTIDINAPVSDKFTKYGIVCNGKQYDIGTKPSISITNEDITISYYVYDGEASAVDQSGLIINYTA